MNRIFLSLLGSVLLCGCASTTRTAMHSAAERGLRARCRGGRPATGLRGGGGDAAPRWQRGRCRGGRQFLPLRRGPVQSCGDRWRWLHGHLGSRDPSCGWALNYREMAPAAMRPDTYATMERSPGVVGSGRGRSGVPGNVAGLLDGTRSLGHAGPGHGARAGDPACPGRLRRQQRLPRGGELGANGSRRTPCGCRRLPGGSGEHLCDSGRLEVGDILKQPEQADVLHRIARDGADAFYRGPVAEAIARTVSDFGG